ncbi:MAG: RCC1 domain-containing protein [Acidimicrobiales bacterium]
MSRARSRKALVLACSAGAVIAGCTPCALAEQPVPAVPLVVSQVAGGGYSGYALGRDGSVWAWGDNLEGQLSNGGAAAASDVPVRVRGLSHVVALAASVNSAYALGRDGTVWAWGDNGQGQLGDARGPVESASPVQVGRLGQVTALAAGGFSAYALGRDGTVWAWGDNDFGELGAALGVLGSTAPLKVQGLREVTALAAGTSDAYALTRGGTVWAWGDDAFGELGTGGAVRLSRHPLQVGGLSGVVSIAAGSYTAYALTRGGTVWAWGDDAFGELGTGRCHPHTVTTCAPSSRPVKVRGLHNVVALAAGAYSGYALEADGTVWAWGYGAYGQLGDGRPGSSATPVKVGKVNHVVAIAAGGNAAYALEADGTVWAWGYGAYGQLGDGYFASSGVPVPVGLPVAQRQA